MIEDQTTASDIEDDGPSQDATAQPTESTSAKWRRRLPPSLLGMMPFVSLLVALVALLGVVGHDHSGDYAKSWHDHSGDYAESRHDHSGDYAESWHDHFHDHSGDYAKSWHDHFHDHSGDYAKSWHSH